MYAFKITCWALIFIFIFRLKLLDVAGRDEIQHLRGEIVLLGQFRQIQY